MLSFLLTIILVITILHWYHYSVFVLHDTCIYIRPALFHLSLLGGFGAPLICKVLKGTGYLSGCGGNAYRRLLETGLIFLSTVIKNKLINNLYLFKSNRNLKKIGKNNISPNFLKKIKLKPISINLNSDKLFIK